MASVSGFCEFGETDKCDAEINKRLGLTRSQAATTLGFYLTVGVPASIGALLGSADRAFGAVIGGVIGAALWYFVDQAWDRFVFRKQFVARGGTDRYPLTVGINGDGLTYQDDALSSTAKWSHISELMLVDDYWFFLIATSAFCHLPRHFFKDEKHERAFIAEALSYMSEAARARSKQAVDFAQRR